jgi:xanthine dehydrogenase small subunit
MERRQKMKKTVVRCIINNREVKMLLPTGMVTLDFIRQYQGLPGTKEGCREGECGACTILVGELDGGEVRYKAVASCLLPLGELNGKHIVTIEGLTTGTLSPIQQALVDEGASQCGFCTPGFVLSLTGFFLTSETLDYWDAIDALDGNICRCTGYVSIQRAVRKLCDTYAPGAAKKGNRVEQLVEWSILPPYFPGIPEQLKTIKSDEDLQAASAPSHAYSAARKGRNEIVVAGGTDLYIQRPEELQDKDLFFISQCKDLTGIEQKDDWLFIGAGTTVEEMRQSALMNRLFPNMKTYLDLVASTIMRNRATLAGNIVNASPIGDLTIILLALNADICLVNGKTRREMPLRNFFKGYKQLEMKKGEIIETIEIPLPYPDWVYRFHFEKVSRRKYLDIASCNTAISIRVDRDIIVDIHLSAGGAAPVPLYLEETCSYLRGRAITGETLLEAVEVMEQEISPISDVRGSAQYKTRLLRNLVFAHFITLFPERKLEEELII